MADVKAVRACALICALLSSIAFAQINPRTISVTASKNVDLAPEEISFDVDVSTDQDTTLEEVIQAIQNTGITTRDFQSVRSGYGYRSEQPELRYSFGFSAPFTRLQEIIAKLEAARGTPRGKKRMDLDFSLEGAGPRDNTVEQAKQSIMPDLISEARRKGQLLAAAAGVTLGPIYSINNEGSGSYFFFGRRSLQYPFSITVQFAIQ